MALRSLLLASTLIGSAACARQAVELRAGTLVPEQVLDGAGLHLSAGWRIALTEAVWLHAESGVDRIAITALTSTVQIPGSTLVVRADEVLWSAPLLAGLVWQGEQGGLSLLGGAAWSRTTLSAEVVDGARLEDSEQTAFDPLLRARVDVAWPLPVGRIVAGAGWQHVFSGADVHPSGLILEVGWRALL